MEELIKREGILSDELFRHSRRDAEEAGGGCSLKNVTEKSRHLLKREMGLLQIL
jgi:hypothetical protein